MDSGVVRITGPLAPYLDGFQSHLGRQGYTALSGAKVARVMSHLSRWLARKQLTARDLDDERIEAFLRHRKRADYTHHLSKRGLAPMMIYLRKVGVVPSPEAATAEDNPYDSMLARYGEYLQDERGLVPSNVRAYKAVARRFLSRYVGTDSDLGRLTATEASDFILKELRDRGVRFAKGKVTALRSFLRYLYVTNETTVDLAVSVPTAAGWRLASLPKFVAPEDVRRLLRSCDRRTHVGCRDYTVLLTLVRLGLRAGEVATLKLEDIDWRCGEIIVHGKRGQSDRLPLPEDVGKALAIYIRRRRPTVASRNVFVRARAPKGGVSTRVVQGIVRSASLRAGLAPMGSHRLRHTAATAMLRGGASLSEIAQVLRHRHVDTTAIYAKVDRVALRELVQPWPGGGA